MAFAFDHVGPEGVDADADGGAFPGSFGEEGEGEELSPEQANQELFDFLVHLKLTGRLSARDVCTLAHYSTVAGLGGPVATLSFRLDAPSGHYNRHFNSVLRFEDLLADAYILHDVPAHDKYNLARTTIDLPVLCPHECLSQEVADNPELVDQLRSSRARGEWPQAFENHVVVQNAGPDEDVWPVALYCDGVPLTRQENMFAFYAYHMLSGKRHLVAVLRRSQICECGCRGWCTMWDVLEFIRWSFSCLAEGQWPSTRHDSTPFLDSDATRASKSGQRLIKAAVVHLKGDWADLPTRLR